MRHATGEHELNGGRFFGGLLDRSIVYSFDRSGFLRHRASFDPRDLEVDLSGRVFLVTGANSGLGLVTASELAARGAGVRMLCRDANRGETARQQIAEGTRNPDIHLELVDLADLESVRNFANAFAGERVDGLVHNAGVLVDERLDTADGIELTLATHVVGPFLLTRLLLPRLRCYEDARVITVSSGGMYTRRLDLTDMQWRRRRFDGVVAYAQAKRAQVVLNELWAERTRGSGIAFHAMHPGWADTPGVRRSLPRFYAWMRQRLRTPEQGADTIVWLAVSRAAGLHNGLFWFDRKPVKTHMVPWTRESEDDRDGLWRCCVRLAGLDDDRLG